MSARALAKLKVFEGVPLKDLDDLLRITAPKRYPVGSVIFRQGQPASGAALLLRGRLDVSVTAEGGGAHCVGQVHPGEIAGEQGLFISQGVRNATVTAMEESLCLTLTLRLLQDGRGNTAVVALERRLIASLARRVRSTNLAIQKAWKEELQARQAAAPPEPSAPTFGQRLLSLFGVRQ